MARGFIRKTSFWKTVGAFRSQWKRALKRFFLPGYGKKGMGWWRNPKKAFYNWWYYRTSVSIPRLLGYKPSRGACIFALTMACLFSVFAAPVDVAKAATKAHRINKARKARVASTTTKKRTSTSGEHNCNYSSTYRNTGSEVQHTSAGNKVAEKRTSYGSSSSRVNYSPTTSTKTKTSNKSAAKSEYVPTYVPPVIKEEEKSRETISYERIRLFEPVEPKIVVEQAPAEPDESTPKSTPKNEKDQFIRKRMIIAGSSYCDKAVLDKLSVGTYFELEAEPDNAYDKDAVKLVYEGEKIGYIAKQDRLAFVTCLKLRRNIYGVITAIKEDEFPVKYEFETWFDSLK